VRAAQRGAFEAVTFMWCYASAQRTNGWIPAWKARELATPRELAALTTIRSTGRAPMLHHPDDECACLDDKAWPAEGGYWAHDFLDRNPSRAENDVQRAKARELKDKTLRHAVKQRDGDRCRYCGHPVRWADRKTGAGGVLDHVDPTIAAGADNLVVACRSCNGQKKDCTPAAAGLTLLPPPADAAVDQRQIYAGSTPDQPPITDPTQIRPRSDSDPGLDPDPDPPPDPHTGSPAHTASTHAPATPINTVITDVIHSQVTTGTGRGGVGTGSVVDRSLREQVGDAGPAGHRRTIGPATTPRTALSPSPYRKSATANPPPSSGPDPP
jgi:5-methylcytosine-specific restriction endonuclease McrA